jgi:hypothetical protein
MNRSVCLFLTTCLSACISLAVSRVAPAAEPPSPATKPAAKSLDEELLQGLDNKLLNGVKEEKPSDDNPPQKASSENSRSEKTPSEKKPLDPLDEQVRDSLSGGEDLGSPGEDQENPLSRIVVKMRLVQQRLAENKADNLTQKEQQRISEELKSLLDQIIQQQQSQAGQNGSQKTSTAKPKSGNAPPGNSPGNPANSPSRDSSKTLRPNHTDRPDPAAARDVAIKELDLLHLPAKDREQLEQAPPDQFLPGHESSIEQYFQRLIEQEDQRP